MLRPGGRASHLLPHGSSLEALPLRSSLGWSLCLSEGSRECAFRGSGSGLLSEGGEALRRCCWGKCGAPAGGGRHGAEALGKPVGMRGQVLAPSVEQPLVEPLVCVGLCPGCEGSSGGPVEGSAPGGARVLWGVVSTARSSSEVPHEHQPCCNRVLGRAHGTPGGAWRVPSENCWVRRVPCGVTVGSQEVSVTAAQRAKEQGQCGVRRGQAARAWGWSAGRGSSCSSEPGGVLCEQEAGQVLGGGLGARPAEGPWRVQLGWALSWLCARCCLGARPEHRWRDVGPCSPCCTLGGGHLSGLPV